MDEGDIKSKNKPTTYDLLRVYRANKPFTVVDIVSPSCLGVITEITARNINAFKPRGLLVSAGQTRRKIMMIVTNCSLSHRTT